MNFLNPNDFSFLSSLKEGFQDIVSEYNAIKNRSMPWAESFLYTGNWDVIGFKYEGNDFPENKELAPKTCALFDSFSDKIHTYGFSIMRPNTEILEHINEDKDADKFLRGHLCLYTNPNAGLVVNNELKNWTVGEFLVFDDTNPHSAHNRGDSDRVVALFDFFK